MNQTPSPSIAVVGVGQWGKNLVRNFATLGALKAVCDPYAEAIEEIVKCYPSVLIKSWQEILHDPSINAVVLSVPADLHFSMAKETLEAKKDVFIEKPVVFSTKDLDKLQQAAKENERFFMAGHVLQYHPIFKEIRKWIDRGDLGSLQHISAQRENLGRVVLKERNVLWSLGCHDLSMILALCKEETLDVSIQSAGDYTGCDYCFLALKFPSGVTARLSCSWIAPKKMQTFWVRGSKGALFWDNNTVTLTFYKQTLETTGPLQETSYEVKVNQEEALRHECAHFIECVAKRTTPLTGYDDILRVTRFIERIDGKNG